ncbi:MAG: hypothetical protein DI565_00175 [Ancylobacter novellus]|uniref:Uncharacterized protein n=1 Tax=Ancylobacter novellus TaxID=921 RepID=A0A2W5KVV1_ANCNO|nr:MAG: hypothetical protein DI565_00175 [Ancylobacter novellus]
MFCHKPSFVYGRWRTFRRGGIAAVVPDSVEPPPSCPRLRAGIHDFVVALDDPSKSWMPGCRRA